MITKNFELKTSAKLPAVIRQENSDAVIEIVYASFTHDAIRYGGNSIDLLQYVKERKLPDKLHFLKDYDEVELKLLVKHSGGKIPLEELLEVRTLFRMAEMTKTLERKPQYLCQICRDY